MKFAVLTIFPEMVAPFAGHGIVRRAVESGRIAISVIDIRNFARGRHRVTDDRPYGGGCGMVMKPEPLAAAIRAAREENPEALTVHLTPQGRPFNQNVARQLAQEKGLNLVCGRYEGIDDRICLDFVDEEISIGDYVLTGGELAAMVVMDAVVRLIPGTLGHEDSAWQDSFCDGLLEHGHYTRPRSFEGRGVPEVLLSGHHGEIERWRREAALIRTFLKRPDLLDGRPLSGEEIAVLKRWCRDIEQLLQRQAEHRPDSSPGGQQEG